MPSSSRRTAPPSPQPYFFQHQETAPVAPPYQPPTTPLPQPSSRGPLSYGPSGPGRLPRPPPSTYDPPYASPPASDLRTAMGSDSLLQTPARLSHLEAALARREQGMEFIRPTIPDMNHPDLAVGLANGQTMNYAGHGRLYRDRSRSPTPAYEEAYASSHPQQLQIANPDMERSSLINGDYDLDVHDREWDEKLEGFRMIREEDTGLVLPAFEGVRGESIAAGWLPGAFGYDAKEVETYGDTGDLADKMADDAPNQHFGPAPQGRVGRRMNHAAGHRKFKENAVLDDNGNYSQNLPIPERLSSILPVKGIPEQECTRYTAVTVGPDDFPTKGLRLRQNANPPRQTEIFIVITMYNENAELFCRTLYGVMKNIAHLCGRKNSRVWGRDGWKKVVVCIVADGRKAVNPRVLDCLTALGVFQERAMVKEVNDEPVTCHVFEYTTSFALDGNLHFKYPDKGVMPCQIIFCMKERNAKKINSHRWFFNAFAPLLSPNVCVLLDVGTMPAPKSIYHLWKAFDVNSNVGGACGEIATFKGRAWRSLLNPLVAAQNFEYKMSNILDKPMESLFGYCTVLPGAFSAYRWIALQNNIDGSGPLASYFQGEQLHTGKADTFTANMSALDLRHGSQLIFGQGSSMYLAEDRILCFEIVAKTRANWVLKFVNSAVGETDCPDTIPEFIAQRRRWLNGSFFAALYSLIHIGQIWRSDHSMTRKLALMLESAYNALQLLFMWFALANFYIFFVILTSALEGKAFKVPHINILNQLAQYGYLGALVACFIFGMGNRPQGSPWKYKATIYFFALLTTYMLVCAVLCATQAIKHIDSPIFAKMVISLISTYGVYIVSSLLALDPWHLVTCFAQYVLFSPTYINVLNVYAYSNLHDLSWGTKGSDTITSDDLGVVHGVGKHVAVEQVNPAMDINALYQDALDRIRVKRAKTDDKSEAPRKEPTEQQQKDIYANFRTNLLLLWTLSNALLASLILSTSEVSTTFDNGASSRTGVYMLCILIFVAGMSMFRFIASTLYLVMRLFGV